MASNKEFTINAKWLGATLRAQPEIMMDAIVKGLRDGALIGEAIVAEATPVDTAQTRQAWRVRFTEDGAELVNDSPVAAFLEGGTRPHRPPLLPLVRWVMRKRGMGGSTTITSLADAPPEAVAGAQALAAKIAREGTPAHHMVEDNLTKLARIARSRVNKRLQAAKMNLKNGS